MFLFKNSIKDYMLNTAAIYKFIHDQTVYYINLGYTSNEIASSSCRMIWKRYGTRDSITER